MAFAARTSAAPAQQRLGFNARLLAIVALGCLLAVAAGAAAGTGQGIALLALFVVVATCVAGASVYARDPVRALSWVWLAVVFNTLVSVWAGYESGAGEQIRRVDEFLVLLLVALTLWRTVQVNTRIPLRYVLPALAFAGFGLAGAVLNHVPPVVSLTGTWLGLKLWTMVAVTLLIPWRPGDVDRIYKVMTRVGIGVALFAVVDFAAHGAAARAVGLAPQFPADPGNPRANAVQSIFYHPGQLSLFMGMLFAFSFARYSGKRDNADLMMSLLFAAAILASLRLKGFLSVALVVLIVLVAQDALGGRRRLTVVVASVALVAGFVALESSVITSQFSRYSSTNQNARRQLYDTGEKLASTNAPLGAGFGRFGTYASRIYYSPVYDDYGLSSTYGLSRKYPIFIDDTSWPGVLGETGYAGVAAYVTGLLLLAVSLAGRIRRVQAANRWIPLAALCALAVVVIDSLGASTLFDWVPATTFALILGPALIATRRARNGSAADYGST